MKLYLSSYRIPTPSDFIKLISKEPRETKIALLPNSKDYYTERARNIKIQAFADDFGTLGFNTEVVDLRDYSDRKTIAAKLSHFDALWACGSNTFCLRYAMRRSGFDQAIKKLVDDGLVFCGDSAGAIVAGPTLRSSEIADNPEFAEEIVWEGLNLVPDFIMPHANSTEFKETLEIVRELYKNDEHYVELNDWEAVVYDHGIRSIVSSQTR